MSSGNASPHACSPNTVHSAAAAAIHVEMGEFGSMRASVD